MNEWKQTFKILNQILSDIFLFVLASWLLFEFILMWLSLDNTIWTGEFNIYIRSIETAVLIFIIIWSTRKIRLKVKEETRNVE